MNTTMRNTHRLLLGAAGLIVAVGIGSVAYGATTNPSPAAADEVATVAVIDQGADPTAIAVSVEALSATDADGILFMVEEEKLARDVYLTLGELWGTPVFTNIASAEQTHMDAVFGLIETYNLEDPVGDNAIGVFTDPELQALYDDLVATGSESPAAALEVGAVIEEVDIEDLVDYLDGTTAGDVTAVYKRLLAGSENHLRAFVSQLERSGVERTPVVLDDATYSAILDGSTGSASNGGGRGAGHGAGQGRGGGWAGGRGGNA